MSTSFNRSTPIHYISGGLGVLFVLHCTSPNKATGAFHMGANLTAVSQFPEESEVLFPPLTLLEVMKDKEGDFMIYEKTEKKEKQEGISEEVLIKEIHVRPSFV